MAAHKIEVKIEPGGKITAQVQGVSGSICELLSGWIDNIGEVIEHRRTEDDLEIDQAKIEVGR